MIFHEYYLNQTYSETLDFNINLISILNLIGNIPLKAWGFNISYFFFSCFSIISFLMLYYIGYDEKILLEPKINTYDLVYTLIAYIFLLIGTGCSSLMSQQIILEYYYKFQKVLSQNKIGGELDNLQIDSKIINEDNIEPLSEGLNKNNFDKTKENPINMMFIFLFIGFLTVFGFYNSSLFKFIFTFEMYQNSKNKSEFFFYQNIYYSISNMMGTIFFNMIFIAIFTKNICQCNCTNEQNKQIEFEDQYEVYKIFGYTIYSESIKSIKINDNQNTENQKTENQHCKCCKLTCKCIKNCCDNVICSSFELCKSSEGSSECCCCCCCNCNEDVFEPDEVSFCYIYKSERNCYWLNKFFSNTIQKEITPYTFIYFLLRLSTIDLDTQYKNNIKIFDNNVDTNYFFYIYRVLVQFPIFFIIFIYITYSLSILSQYISGKSKYFNNNKQSKISQGKSVLNSIFGILLFNSIFSIYLSLSLKKNNNSNFFYSNISHILIPLSMNKFFYLALSFYASRNSDIEGTGQKISSSILITVYISIADFIIYLIYIHLNFDSILYYIQISASFFSLIFSLILIIKVIFKALIRKDCLFFIYLLFIIFFLGPCSNCILKKMKKIK